MANWYAVYLESDGTLKSVGTSVGNLPEGHSSKLLGSSRPDGLWNTQTLAFDPHPENTRIGTSKFMARFTAIEAKNLLLSVEGIEVGNNEKTVRAFTRLLMIVDQIDTSHQFIAAGLNACVATGIITEQRKQEIING